MGSLLPKSSRILVCALLALAPLAAANTLTVGPVGSGAAFTQVQAAIDAAQPDDVLLVQPGVYAPIVVDKPLRILGAGSGSVRLVGLTPNGVVVRGIPAGRELVLSGIEVRVPSIQPTIQLENSPGTLVLQDVLVQGGFAGVALQAQGCGRVLLLACRFLTSGRLGLGLGALEASQSTLWLANDEITGAGDAFTSQLPCPAIGARGSTLHVWRTRLVGGSSVGKGAGFGPADGAAAIRAESSQVTLYGGPGAELIGGQGGESVFGGFPGGPALELLTGSRARVQADVPVTGGFDAAGVLQAPDVLADATSSVQSLPQVLPSLASSTHQTSLGGAFDLALSGRPASLQVLYLSVATGPDVGFPRVLGLGCLDSTRLFELGRALLPASGTWTVPVQIPPVSSLLGTTLFFQSVESHASTFAIGNPELVTITG